jgi:tetratricopeptide (TPR) repeat protein
MTQKARVSARTLTANILIMSIKEFFENTGRAFSSGKAYKRMELGDYQGAANLLEKKHQEKTDSPNIEYSLYCLGFCYYKLGNLGKAKECLSKSRDLYTRNISSNNSFTYRQCFRDSIELYCKVLRISGSNDLAEQVMDDLDFGS